QVLIMALLGGLYSFFGPALGAAVLYTLQVGINQYTEYWPIVLGVILLAILMFLPDGLIGLAQKIRTQFIRKA
ncbi:MAG TPA: branched-chain amino acid ABC transporter permease, partial [Alphaproteobacteria bacterium]|nr:branched-chain amino acid ABC transporter permease [Alphaproteobacteria bacterium]